MKQDDPLKRFIQEHRESFDDEPVPTALYGKIFQKTTPIRRLFTYGAAAACAALLIIATLTFQSKPQESIEKPIAQSGALQTPSAPKETIASKETSGPKEPADPKEHSQPELVTKQEKARTQVTDRGPTTHRKTDPLLAGLTGREKVSEKISAILQVTGKETVNDRTIATLGRLFTQDESSNVRLAALNALENRRHEPAVRDLFVEGLSSEKDPVIQMELVRLLSHDQDTVVTEKLLELAQTPFTLPQVKDQINFALLTRMDN